MVYVSVSLCARQRALYKNGRTDREPVWQADFGRPKEPCIRWGPHGLHLANTSKRSVRGGDADLRQVTLTIFFRSHFDSITQLLLIISCQSYVM